VHSSASCFRFLGQLVAAPARIGTQREKRAPAKKQTRGQKAIGTCFVVIWLSPLLVASRHPWDVREGVGGSADATMRPGVSSIRRTNEPLPVGRERVPGHQKRRIELWAVPPVSGPGKTQRAGVRGKRLIKPYGAPRAGGLGGCGARLGRRREGASTLASKTSVVRSLCDMYGFRRTAARRWAGAETMSSSKPLTEGTKNGIFFLGEDVGDSGKTDICPSRFKFGGRRHRNSRKSGRAAGPDLGKTASQS